MAGVGWASDLAGDGGEEDAEKLALRWGWSILCHSTFVGPGILIILTVLAHALLALEPVMSFSELVRVTGLLYPRSFKESSSELYALGVVVAALPWCSEEAARKRRRRRCMATIQLCMRVGIDLSKMIEGCRMHCLATSI